MSTRKVSTLRSDAPIICASNHQDTLRRARFASQIVDEYLLPLRDWPLVISLEGPWGTGKTSAFNLMKKQLRSSGAIVFDFNPWTAGSAESLTEAFLLQLATEIGLADRAKQGQTAAKQLIGYSSVFTALKFIPGAEPWASLVEGVVRSVGNATAAASDLKKLNLEKRKAAVVSALLKLDRPIVAFIDDLDRLTPPEVFQIIRVVKAVADFPRMTYLLAFDVAHVESALKLAGIERSVEYLEKLVQVRLSVPAIARRDILAMLERETAALPAKVREPFQKEDEGRLGFLYQLGLCVLIETPRDVNRIFNRLALSANALAGEVAFAELFALEVLAVKCPKVYEQIRADPEFFLKPHKPEPVGLGSPPPPDPFAGILELIDERYRPHVAQILRQLFPAISESSAYDERRRFRSMGRIAAPDRLYAALSFGTPAGELPLVEVRSFIADRTSRAEFITGRLTADTVERLFEHIDTFPDLAVHDPEDFIQAIATVCDSDCAVEHDAQVRQGTFGISIPRRASVTVHRRLDSLEPSIRKNILQRVIAGPGSRELAAELAAECYTQHTQKGSYDERGGKRQWLTLEDESSLREAWAARALPSLVDPKIDPIKLRGVYRTARFICPEKLQATFARVMQTDAGLDRFARLRGNTGVISPGGPYVEISDQELSEVGDKDTLRKLAASRLRTLPERSDLELRCALKSMATGKAFFTTTGKEARSF